MRMTRIFAICILLLGLVLAPTLGTVATVSAATPDMSDRLASALNISAEEINNYPINYQASLPIPYAKGDNACYVALGGVTAAGTSSSVTQSYADLIAAQLGLEANVNYFKLAVESGLTATGALEYINQENVATCIQNADLVTFQLDGADFLAASMKDVPESAMIPWESYVTDPAFLAEIATFHTNVTAEYAAEYGDAAAGKLATTLEYMLFESVVYSQKTIEAVQAIRAKNSTAVILVLGLYNPLRGLTLTANGKAMDLGGMMEELITVTNTYLLKQTKDMERVGFVDISATGTNGFSSEALNTADNDALTGQLNTIATAADKQYANQIGQDHIKDQVLNATKAPCQHLQTEISGEKEPSCQEFGYTGDICCVDCGDVITYGSEIPKEEHDYDEWFETIVPGCTEKGQETRGCYNCTHTETRDVDPAGHKVETGDLILAPTCTEKGEMTGVCTVCSLTVTVEVDATGHKLDNGTVIKEPTCTEKGEMSGICTVCSLDVTVEVAANGHKLDNGTVTREPTCSVKGEMTFACTVCDHTETQPIALINHTMGPAYITHKPTCTQSGLKTAFCYNCNYKEQQEVAPIEHKWNEGTVTKEPTCTEKGEKLLTCTVCYGTTTEEVETIEHTWNEGAETKAPTCTEEGELTFTCTACTATRTEPIDKIPHAMGEATISKAPTCEEPGEKTGACVGCGEAMSEVIPAAGHTYGPYTPDGNATCMYNGSKTAVCQACKAEDTVTDEGSRIDHSYANGYCVMCGRADPNDNSNLLIIVVASGVALFSGGMLAFLFFKKKSFVR